MTEPLTQPATIVVRGTGVPGPPGPPGADSTVPGPPGPPGAAGVSDYNLLSNVPTLNVAAYGVVADGVTDTTAAVQAAVNAALGSRKRRVILPAGTYVFGSSINAAGTIEIVGEGQERTVIIPPANAPAFTFGNLTASQPHGLRLADMTFRQTTASDTTAPVVDVQSYGRKWVVERVNFDLGFANRTALRLYTSWVGSVRDCNFWKVGAEGVAGQRAALLVKPQQVTATALGPINNVTIADCAFERVQVGVDLHDPAETGVTTSIYSVVISGCRFKNSATSGPMANSIGIRSNNNQTYGVAVVAPFFEDFDIGVQVRGWGWVITAPFGQSATTVVDLATGGAHVVESLILQGSANNAIGTGVLAEAGVTGTCEVRRWKSITGASYLTNGTLDQSGGKLVVTAA